MPSGDACKEQLFQATANWYQDKKQMSRCCPVPFLLCKTLQLLSESLPSALLLPLFFTFCQPCLRHIQCRDYIEAMQGDQLSPSDPSVTWARVCSRCSARLGLAERNTVKRRAAGQAFIPAWSTQSHICYLAGHPCQDLFG